MVGLWYAVPTLVIIGKSFPLSPHGEAECQVSMHKATNQNGSQRQCCTSRRVALQCFRFVCSLDSWGRAKRPTKIHEIPWMNQYTVILSKRRKISAYCTDPRVSHNFKKWAKCKVWCKFVFFGWATQKKKQKQDKKFCASLWFVWGCCQPATP